MRRLILFRHAEAERAVPGTSDHDRPLTERGRANAATIGAYLGRHRLVPDRVLISPAERTRETWQCMAFTAAPAPLFETRLYDAAAQAIFNVIAEAPSGARALLVLAHNPGLHELSQLLVGTGDIDTRERLREGLPTCGLAVIDFALDNWKLLHARAGRLERFVTPKSIAAATN